MKNEKKTYFRFQAKHPGSDERSKTERTYKEEKKLENKKKEKKKNQKRSYL